ncbi:MAG: hypothetical protein HKN42_08500 [Granulosicoccus sp.]|nr:hypothetical protein [Granulosicoccus sp.]
MTLLPLRPQFRQLMVPVTGLSAMLMLAACQVNLPPSSQVPSASLSAKVTEPPYASSTRPAAETAERFAPSWPRSDGNLQPTPWIQSIHPLFLRARALVEDELKVDLKNVRLLLVDDSPINDEVSRETRRLVNEQFGNSPFAEQFLGRVMKSQAGTYAALFTSRLNAVMVSRNMLESYENSLAGDAHVRSSALLTLLIHELVHAADDQRYAIHENRALNFRASFAQSATFEGHAQWVTRRICAEQDCTIGLDALDDFMFSRDGRSHQLTQPVEAISRNVLEYSYIEGERFIATLAQRTDGARLIEQLLRHPPYDPIQILAPEKFPDIARERRNQRLIKASLDIDHPWVQDHWIGVETSPLKGVDLRADPARRQAAVDGFTRLIEGMVAMQLYDRSNPDSNPVEVTLLQAESASTASLFARTLHENTQLAGAELQDEPLRINTGAGTEQSTMNMHVYRTTLPYETHFRTAIGVSGLYVVQIAGASRTPEPLDDYAIRVLLNLQLPR